MNKKGKTIFGVILISLVVLMSFIFIPKLIGSYNLQPNEYLSYDFIYNNQSGLSSNVKAETSCTWDSPDALNKTCTVYLEVYNNNSNEVELSNFNIYANFNHTDVSCYEGSATDSNLMNYSYINWSCVNANRSVQNCTILVPRIDWGDTFGCPIGVNNTVTSKRTTGIKMVFSVPVYEGGEFNITFRENLTNSTILIDPDIGWCATLTNSTDTYKLNQSITVGGGLTCFTTGADNVTLNGQGHYIDGYGSGSKGIVSYNNNLTVYNLSIIHDWFYGVYLDYGVHDNLFYNNNISLFSSVSNCVVADGAYNNLFKDSIIYNDDNRGSNVHLYGAGNVTFLNVTFNRQDFEFFVDPAKMFVGWWVDIYTNDTLGNNLNNVNVTIKDKNNLAYYEPTNSSGFTPRQSISEYFVNRTNTYYLTNYTFNGTKTGYTSAQVSKNISTNFVDSNKVVLTLIPLSPIINYTSPTLQNNSYINYNWIYVNVTTSMISDSCVLELDNATNSSMAGSSTNFYINDSVVTEKLYKYIIYCNASAGGLWGSSIQRFITYDKTSPQIEFVSPPTPNNEVITNRSLTINISITETNPSKLILEWDGANETYAYNNGTTYNIINKSNLLNGNYTFYAWANDTATNNNITETRWVYVNSSQPISELISPSNGYSTNITSRIFSCNQSINGLSANLSNSTFFWDYNGTFIENGSIVVSGLANETNFSRTNLTDKHIEWNCYVCNLNNDCVFAPSNYLLIIDTTYPLISYNPNTDNGLVIKDNFLVNVSYYDNNTDRVLLYVNNNTYDFPSPVGNDSWINLTSLSDGNYTFYTWINDTSGQTNQTTNRTVTVDAVSPSINIIHPYSGQTYSVANFPYLIVANVSITDNVALTNCTYNIEKISGGYEVNNTSFNCSSNTFTFPISTDASASYYLNIIANSSNHSSSSSQLFLISKYSNPGSPGTNPTQPYVCDQNNVSWKMQTSTGGTSYYLIMNYNQTRSADIILTNTGQNPVNVSLGCENINQGFDICPRIKLDKSTLTLAPNQYTNEVVKVTIDLNDLSLDASKLNFNIVATDNIACLGKVNFAIGISGLSIIFNFLDNVSALLFGIPIYIILIVLFFLILIILLISLRQNKHQQAIALLSAFVTVVLAYVLIVFLT